MERFWRRKERIKNRFKPKKEVEMLNVTGNAEYGRDSARTICEKLSKIENLARKAKEEIEQSKDHWYGLKSHI